MSKEIMINFNQDMVRAILDGSKTQTRRPLKKNPLNIAEGGNAGHRKFVSVRADGTAGFTIKPRFQPGDIMCVRERARCTNCSGANRQMYKFQYEADKTSTGFVNVPPRIKPIKLGHCVPGGCFKELVRIKRKVVRVWFERIQDISWIHAMNEGVKVKPSTQFACPDLDPNWPDGPESNGYVLGPRACVCYPNCPCGEKEYLREFKELWGSIYPGSWERNDWVECTEFEGVK